MVSPGADNSDIDPIPLVPAGEAINDIDTISRIQVVNSTFAVDSPDLTKKANVSGGNRYRGRTRDGVAGGGKKW
jgi:hypothetical protein